MGGALSIKYLEKDGGGVLGLFPWLIKSLIMVYDETWFPGALSEVNAPGEGELLGSATAVSMYLNACTAMGMPVNDAVLDGLVNGVREKVGAPAVDAVDCVPWEFE